MAALNRLLQTTTFRLSLLYFALFAAAAGLAIAYIYWNTNVLLARQLRSSIDSEIQVLAEQYSQGGLERLAESVGERSLTPGDSLYLLTDSNGTWVAGNLRQVSSKLWNTQGPAEFIFRRPGAQGPERRLGFANIYRLAGGYRLFVGRDIEGRREFGRVVRSAFLWGLGFMLLVGLGGGWLISRNLLARMNAVTATSRRIMHGDLSERVPVSGSGDEFDRLSKNLNDMLERIESLMNGLREVSDNIAHDLKTPLTRLRNRVEGALRDSCGEGAYRDVLERTIEEADDLMKTFNALLSIARLEAGAVREEMRETDLSSAVLDVAEFYEPVAEESGIKFVAEGEQGILIQADRQLIGQAVANLIENALKYGRRENQEPVIAVSVRRTNEFAEVIVADNGPGIPEADRARVLKRFVRLEESRSAPGSGLGLSLVAAVARLHDGELLFEDNAPGLRTVLRFPLLSDVLNS